MRTNAGFTLVEISIVLVIVGLLLGGILKGGELIDNAKLKNLQQDFRHLPAFIHAYEDMYKASPGDDANADAHLGANLCPATDPCVASSPANSQGDGVINGWWNSNNANDESIRLWRHLRLAGLMSGPTATPQDNVAAFLPKNAYGGVMGVAAGDGDDRPIISLRARRVACSQNIPGKLALQLDIALDDGASNSGAMQVMANQPMPQTAAAPAIAAADLDREAAYTVCMSI